MDKKDYIARTFRKILKEDLQEKAHSLMNKLNLDKETDLYSDNSFDYVQEGKGMCESCGGEMREGECSECGYRNEAEIMELGGMEDGHPRFGNKNLNKMTRREKEDLMNDRSYEMRSKKFDDDFEEISFSDYDDDSDLKKSRSKKRKHNDDTEDVEFDLELDESWYSHDEYERMRNLGDEDELQAYQDKLVSGGEKEDDEDYGLNIPDDMPSYKTKYRYREEDEITEKLHGKQHKLDKNKNGRLDKEDFKMLRKQQDEEQLYEVEFEKEGETEEGNAFTGMLKKTPKGHSFKLGGKEYKDRSSLEEKWNKEVDVKQTGEYSDMSIEELNAAIKKQKAKNDKTMDSGKKVSHADKTKMSQLYFAKRAKQGWKEKGKAKVTESILYTESDLIDLIEKLVITEKNSFKMKEPKGYREYERVHKNDKKENEDYLKLVTKKMTDYLKDMSSDKDSKYEMKGTQKFPTENGGLNAKRKKYTPSQAVDDYIEAFSYPGQTNLVYDEIKPNDEMIEKQIKGHSTNGNAQVDKDGNALGNVVPSKTGDRFYKNFEENLYGQEQQDASYKRQPQPVDQAGETTERGSLKSKRGKKTSKSVLNKVEESVNSKKENQLNEEFDRMQKLMDYSRKTQ